MHYIDGRYLAYIEEVTGYSASQIYRRHRAAMITIERLIASGALMRRKEGRGPTWGLFFFVAMTDLRQMCVRLEKVCGGADAVQCCHRPGPVEK